MFRSFFFVVIALIASLTQAGTNEEGLKFLAAKEKEDGVVKLPSGLLYKGAYRVSLAAASLALKRNEAPESLAMYFGCNTLVIHCN